MLRLCRPLRGRGRNGVPFSIELSTNKALVGLRSTRHIKLDGDRLTLSGPDFAAGTDRTQQIVWREQNRRPSERRGGAVEDSSSCVSEVLDARSHSP